MELIKKTIPLMFFVFALHFVVFAEVKLVPYKTINVKAQAVYVGNIDNVGRDDIVVTSQTGKTYVVYGNGGINNGLNEISPKGGSALCVSRIDNNSFEDIVISKGDSLVIIFNDGSFKDTTMYSGKNIVAIRAGDLNNDGLTDIAVTHKDDSYIRVFYQNNSSTFDFQDYSWGDLSLSHLDIADINNDGLKDLIFLVSKGSPNSKLYFLAQQNDGSLADTVKVNKTGERVNSFVVGPLYDNENSIVTVEGTNTPITKLRIRKALGSAPKILEAYDVPNIVRIGDLNGDLKNDLAVVNYSWNAISSYEQEVDEFYGYKKVDSPNQSYAYDAMSLGYVYDDQEVDVVLAANDSIVIFRNYRPIMDKRFQFSSVSRRETLFVTEEEFFNDQFFIENNTIYLDSFSSYKLSIRENDLNFFIDELDIVFPEYYWHNNTKQLSFYKKLKDGLIHVLGLSDNETVFQSRDQLFNYYGVGNKEGVINLSGYAKSKKLAQEVSFRDSFYIKIINPLRGDVNRDGVCDEADAEEFAAYQGGYSSNTPGRYTEFDINYGLMRPRGMKMLTILEGVELYNIWLHDPTNPVVVNLGWGEPMSSSFYRNEKAPSYYYAMHGDSVIVDIDIDNNKQALVVVYAIDEDGSIKQVSGFSKKGGKFTVKIPDRSLSYKVEIKALGGVMPDKKIKNKIKIFNKFKIHKGKIFFSIARNKKVDFSIVTLNGRNVFKLSKNFQKGGHYINLQNKISAGYYVIDYKADKLVGRKSFVMIK